MLSSSQSRMILLRSLRRRPRYYSSEQIRHFSKTFSSYEYPLATEAPEVTTTSAKEASVSTNFKTRNNESNLSELEIEHIRKLQREHIPTSLTGSQPITLEVPSEIPPNVPSSSLETPETTITTLGNGLRVVSQETYGQVCSIGVLGDFGSRHESEVGTAHLVETLAFPSTTKFKDSAEIQQLLQDWGATQFCSSGREQTLWCLDILRPNVEKGMELLQQVTMEPMMHHHEIEDAKQTMLYQGMEMMPEMVLSEAVQQAAYGTGQQLGKAHFCPMDKIQNLSAATVGTFLQTNFLSNPENVVVAGAGIDHEELVDMATHHFGHLKQESSNRTIKSEYRGGECKMNLATPSIDGMARVAVAVELGGWHSDDLVPTCVLQTLLGGGNSFSAGGPGKGMYSRLYRQVLNRYFWADAAEAFTAFHAESGMLGISGSCPPAKARDLVGVLSEHLMRLRTEAVTDEELDRARNMLKCNVLTQLESRLVLFEDMGRQVLTFGKRDDNATMCAKIDAVTKEDLLVLMQRALSKPPTLAAAGDDVSLVPSYADVQSWFGRS